MFAKRQLYYDSRGLTKDFMKPSEYGIWKEFKVNNKLIRNIQAPFHLSCTRAPFHYQALCTYTLLPSKVSL